MTSGTEVGAYSAGATGFAPPGRGEAGTAARGEVGTAARGEAGTAARGMRFSVDGWDPGYGASLELDGELGESTARVETGVEVPADRWRPVDPAAGGPLPDALLFVDGVRRVEARVWVDGAYDGHGLADAVPARGAAANGAARIAGPAPAGPAPAGPAPAGPAPASTAPASTAPVSWAPDATEALCASYAAGVVCCCAAGAHLVAAELRRGLFSVAPHASDIQTRAGGYRANLVTQGKAGVPVMTALSQSLQRRLAEVEVITATQARGAADGHTGRQARGDAGDLLIVDGPLHGRQHLPRALGYIKSHRATYLPPELNAMVGTLAPGQRTPVFLMGTSWDRHSWYLRLPGPAVSPWAGVVRVECPADLPVTEVTRLAGLSQRVLGRFASVAYKDSRAPQNLYPIAGLERELRRRLGDPQLLYRALREAAHPSRTRLRPGGQAEQPPARPLPGELGQHPAHGRRSPASRRDHVRDHPRRGRLHHRHVPALAVRHADVVRGRAVQRAQLPVAEHLVDKQHRRGVGEVTPGLFPHPVHVLAECRGELRRRPPSTSSAPGGGRPGDQPATGTS
jgi:hypothetical protein